MKKNKTVSILTILAVLAGSMLTLFASGCVSWKNSKTVNLSEAAPGDTLSYVINIRNTGNSASHATVVTDLLDPNLERSNFPGYRSAGRF